MNYYEHHIGDYAQATAHLSFVEDAAYGRLIRKYYAEEKPLPIDLKAVQRLTGARTREEREAVETVLNEFFTLEDDGWHNKRCDVEIARYHEGDAERAQKKAHENERMRRHREERARLFAELREFGITPKWDATVTQLRELLKNTGNAPATRTGALQVHTGNAPATANQTPDTSHQTPDLKPKPEPAAAVDQPGGASGEESPPSRSTAIAVLLRGWERNRGKASKVTSTNPTCTAWAEAGITDAELREAYQLAVADRDANGDATPINAGFLDVFLAKLRNPGTGGSAVVASAPKAPVVCCICGTTASKRIMADWYCPGHDQFSERTTA